MQRHLKAFTPVLLVLAAIAAGCYFGSCTVLKALAGQDTSEVSDAQFESELADVTFLVEVAVVKADLSGAQRLELAGAILQVASGQSKEVVYSSIMQLEIEDPLLEAGVLYAAKQVMATLEQNGCWVDGKLTERGAQALKAIGYAIAPDMQASLLWPSFDPSVAVILEY